MSVAGYPTIQYFTLFIQRTMQGMLHEKLVRGEMFAGQTVR